MAIGYIKQTEYNTSGTRTSDTLAFSPGAAVAGILVTAYHGATNTDRIPDGNLAYGGVNVPRIRLASDTDGEPGNVYAFFLGDVSAIPQGDQNLVPTYNASMGTSITWNVFALSGDRDLEVVVHNAVTGDVDDPSIALAVSGRNAYAFSVCYSGLQDINTELLAGTGVSRVDFNDFGNYGGAVGRQTSGPSTSDFTFAWSTSGADDVAMIALSIAEVDPIPVTGVGASIGAAIASGAGRANITQAGSSVGAAIASGAGRANISWSGSAYGFGLASGVGMAASQGIGVGASIGVAIATAVGASTHAGAGSITGSAAAQASGGALHARSGASVGASFASGAGGALASGVGSSIGHAVVSGGGASIHTGVGASWGWGIASGAWEQAAPEPQLPLARVFVVEPGPRQRTVEPPARRRIAEPWQRAA